MFKMLHKSKWGKQRKCQTEEATKVDMAGPTTGNIQKMGITSNCKDIRMVASDHSIWMDWSRTN